MFKYFFKDTDYTLYKIMKLHTPKKSLIKSQFYKCDIKGGQNI